MHYLSTLYEKGIYTPSSIWVFLLFFFIISPVLEEIVFRGLIQEFLVKKLTNKFLAFILLNLGFMLAHWHIRHDALYLFLVFLCGMSYSLAKDFFGFLRYPIGLHISFNFIFLML